MNLIRGLIYAVFFIAYSLVTFFGIGPVLMADGSLQERLITLAVVLLIYAVLTVAFILIHKKIKNSNK